jgi:hypothetical protein
LLNDDHDETYDEDYEPEKEYDPSNDEVNRIFKVREDNTYSINPYPFNNEPSNNTLYANGIFEDEDEYEEKYIYMEEPP